MRGKTIHGQRRALLWAGALCAIALTAVCGCVNFNRNDIFTGQGQTTGPSGAGSPSPQAGACEKAARLNAGVIGGGVVTVGSIERLDTTAFTASGQEITGACAQAKNPAWAPFVGPCAFTTSPTGFNPSFRGTAPGSCSTSVTLDGISAEVPITVQP